MKLDATAARQALRSLRIAGAAAVLAFATSAQEVTRAADEEAARRIEEIKRSAASYTITTDDDSAVALKLLPEPVLRWNNPVYTATDGGVFLWLRDGRPEVVTTVYRKRPDGVATERHEFQSLADGPLRATFDGRQIWAPRTAGMTLAPIPGAPAPAPTRPERLRQIRTLVRDFQVETNQATGTGMTHLRLLSQPLYRYEHERTDVVDGALFAFVLATDPDALLAIEARPAGGSLIWQYGFARMTGRGLKAAHAGRTVWEAPHFATSPKDPGMTYIGIPSPAMTR